jgi:hypothetical protein
MACVRGQSFQRLRKDAIENNCFGEISGIDPLSDGKTIVVCSVALVSRCKEDGRIDECTWHLFDVDTPRVVVVRYVGLLVAVVPFKIAERSSALLDDLDTKRLIVFDLPAKFVAVIDI